VTSGAACCSDGVAVGRQAGRRAVDKVQQFNIAVHLFIPEMSHRCCVFFVKTEIPNKDRFIIKMRNLYIAVIPRELRHNS